MSRGPLGRDVRDDGWAGTFYLGRCLPAVYIGLREHWCWCIGYGVLGGLASLDIATWQTKSFCSHNWFYEVEFGRKLERQPK